MAHKPDNFLLLDSHSALYRLHHAPGANLSCPCGECGGKGGEEWKTSGDLPNAVEVGRDTCPSCQNTGQEPTKAVYGFTRLLIRLCREIKPSYLALACDGKRSKLGRRQIDPAYKASRGEAPWEVPVQMRRVKQICKALGVCLIEGDGDEADDILASLAWQTDESIDVTIASTDRDFWQLLGRKNITLYDPWKDEKTLGLDVLRLTKKLTGTELAPQQICDWKALCGETGDEIPCVGGGWGEKTAAKFLYQWGDLAGIEAHAKELPDRLRQAFTLRRERLDKNQTLVFLKRDIDLSKYEDQLSFTGLNLKRAAPVFRSLRFGQMR